MEWNQTKYDFTEYFINGVPVSRDEYFSKYHEVMSYGDLIRYKVYVHLFIDHKFRTHYEHLLFFNECNFCDIKRVLNGY